MARLSFVENRFGARVLPIGRRSDRRSYRSLTIAPCAFAPFTIRNNIPLPFVGTGAIFSKKSQKKSRLGGGA
jgi:hypothetical protein